MTYRLLGAKQTPRWRSDDGPALLKIHPRLNFHTFPNWMNVKIHYSLIGLKVKILNTLSPLAAT